MEVFSSAGEISSRIAGLRQNGEVIGFVPTMGALHPGHINLVEIAGRSSTVVVVSIFVNPTQFNNKEDLKRYPRDLEKDIKLLGNTPCKLVFAPGENDIYPEPDNRLFDLGSVGEVMEGKHRPGHFNGVAQVVSRLFDIVKPHKAFFGLKDFQQVAVINRLVGLLNYDVEIVACPTVREPDGLAMSSRNLLLTVSQRKNAPLIAKTLFDSCNFVSSKGINETKRFVIDTVNSSPELDVEYFEIVDGDTLQPLATWDQSSHVVGCIAVNAGQVRLIDNVVYKNRGL